jgi:hypothetical protein
VSILDDVDPDILICRLAGPLCPSIRPAFRQAAEAALACVPCQGEGIVYRTIAPLQRKFFDPPSDLRMSWDVTHEIFRSSKLRAGPPLDERDRDRRFTRHPRPTR